MGFKLDLCENKGLCEVFCTATGVVQARKPSVPKGLGSERGKRNRAPRCNFFRKRVSNIIKLSTHSHVHLERPFFWLGQCLTRNSLLVTFSFCGAHSLWPQCAGLSVILKALALKSGGLAGLGGLEKVCYPLFCVWWLWWLLWLWSVGFLVLVVLKILMSLNPPLWSLVRPSTKP